MLQFPNSNQIFFIRAERKKIEKITHCLPGNKLLKSGPRACLHSPRKIYNSLWAIYWANNTGHIICDSSSLHAYILYAYCHSSAHTVDDLSTVFVANRQQTILEEKAKSDKLPSQHPALLLRWLKNSSRFLFKGEW